MWMILQQPKPDDFVIATGETHSVREFVDLTFKEIGIDIEWTGQGLDEKGIDKNTGKTLVVVDKKYFRPTEVDLLLGDPTKAKKILNWEPRITFKKLVNEMVESELKNMNNEIASSSCIHF
jgi:GDPmannose 4,6-dehydratase